MEEKRKLPRYILGSSGNLLPPGASKPLEIKVPVLSVEGALIECQNPPAVGQRCRLNIHWKDTTITVSAEVRSRQQDGRAGMMFVRVDPESRERLQAICAGLPRDESKPPARSHS